METILDPRADLRSKLAQLTVAAPGPNADARYLTLCDEFEAIAHPLRRTLLLCPLAWTSEERREAQWLHETADDLAALGHRLAVDAAARGARDVVANAFFYMGETVKWDVSVAPDSAHDMRKVHALMRLVIEHGLRSETLGMRFDGRVRECTLEALYFRVLLLARFSSGALNGKQIEILDAWMWMWMPVLAGVDEHPSGTVLRADLDSAIGLQQGPRASDGPSLYLPREPIEAAYYSVVTQFHAGCMVPSEGLASEFRIEEHVAVLGLVRRNLRQSRREPVARAPRRRVDAAVELFVGLAEIMKLGFAPSAPEAAPMALSPVEAGASGAPRVERDFDTAVADIYERERRIVRLLDQSDTGLGLEGAGDLAAVAAGDLVAVRLAAGEPLIFGKVVRSVASKTPGNTVIGVRRLSGSARIIPVQRDSGSHGPQDLEVLVITGTDTSGRHDGKLVAERDFIERAPMQVTTPDRHFRERMNRTRERGRGWVLAGFEVASARPNYKYEIA